jgi:hypothetical protein
MKLSKLALAAISLLFLLASCKKASTQSTTPGGGSGTKVTKIQEGTDPSNDTLYFFHYTGSSGLADYIIDSFAGYPGNDTDFLSYDSYGHISYIIDHYGSPQTFSFNPNGTLAEIDGNGYSDNYIFSYSGTVVTGMQDVIPGYGINITYDYTVNSAGDVTEVLAYQGNHVSLISDITYTYTSHSNTLFNLEALGSYFDVNFWGLSTYNLAAIVSAHLPASYTDGTNSVTYTYTYNGQNITKLQTYDPALMSFTPFQLSTLQFSY